MGATLVVVLGIAGSIVGARAVAQSVDHKAQNAFAADSTDVAVHLKLALGREQELVLNAGALIASSPGVTNAGFNRWMQADRVFSRHPEVVVLGRIVVVSAAQLPAFAARTIRERAGTPASIASFKVTPPGNRPFYCLGDLGAAAPLYDLRTPAGLDLCTGGARAMLMASRDSGQGAYEPTSLGKISMLAIQTPLYRDGVIPKTIAARRTAFAGWIALGIVPNVALITALDGHPGTAVTLRYTRGLAAVAFSSGTAPRGARSLTTDFHNGWTVRVSAATGGSGVLASREATGLAIGGIALSVLLGILGIVLATERTRARRLVREQTVELRKQAAALRGTISELGAAQTVKDEFLALVSHELRSPLTSIVGYTELLQTEDLADDQRGWVKVIEANSKRLQGLVEDLLLMAQLQSGGIPLQLAEVGLGDLITRSVEAARPSAVSNQIELAVATEAGITTQGDATRLGQVVDNLLSNAIKYTPSGGDVTITTTLTGEAATIIVQDTGIGIPEDEQDRMFGRFFRTSAARRSHIKGTGLGLAITRGIVEAHGGTIGFESVEGEGTTFRVTLPNSSGALETEAAPATVEERRLGGGIRRRVVA